MTEDNEAPYTPPAPDMEKSRGVLPVPKWLRRARSAFFALGCFPALFIVLSFFAGTSVVSEICCHFYIQYFVTLCIAVAGLALLSQWRAALVFAPFLIWTAIQLAPYYLPYPFIPGSYQSISVVAFNVNTANTHYDDVARYILSTGADIVSVEEVSHEWMKHLTPLLSKSFPYGIAQPREDNFGIALYSKYPFKKARIETYTKPGFPTAIAQIDFGGTPITLMCVHPPPPISELALELRTQCSTSYAKSEEEWMQEPGQGHRFIIMGDFNSSPWSPYFQQFLRESWTHDTALGQGLQTTWPYDNLIMQTPIDHILVSPDFATIERRRDRTYGSDHHAIYAKLAIVN